MLVLSTRSTARVKAGLRVYVCVTGCDTLCLQRIKLSYRDWETLMKTCRGVLSNQEGESSELIEKTTKSAELQPC